MFSHSICVVFTPILSSRFFFHIFSIQILKVDKDYRNSAKPKSESRCYKTVKRRNSMKEPLPSSQHHINGVKFINYTNEVEEKKTIDGTVLICIFTGDPCGDQVRVWVLSAHRVCTFIHLYARSIRFSLSLSSSK